MNIKNISLIQDYISFKLNFVFRVVEIYWCISKKVSTPPIYTFGWVCYVILKKNISALTFLVSNSNCLKYLCVLTFLTYRFYFLLNLTILFFTYFFWNIWFDLFRQPCVPLNFSSIFPYLLSESIVFKRKACRLLTMALKSAF